MQSDTRDRRSGLDASAPVSSSFATFGREEPTCGRKSPIRKRVCKRKLFRSASKGILARLCELTLITLVLAPSHELVEFSEAVNSHSKWWLVPPRQYCIGQKAMHLQRKSAPSAIWPSHLSKADQLWKCPLCGLLPQKKTPPLDVGCGPFELARSVRHPEHSQCFLTRNKDFGMPEGPAALVYSGKRHLDTPIASSC